MTEDYSLFLNKHDAVMTRYICQKCNKVKDIPHYLYQEGVRAPCLSKRKPKDIVITKRVTKVQISKTSEFDGFAVPVQCVVDNVKYDSISAAANKHSVSNRTIGRWMDKYPDRCYRLG